MPIYMLILIVVMALFQVIFVTPNELDNEELSIKNNIEYTKEAYGINTDVFTIENGGETVTEEMLTELKML